jgi:hypothetical protein
MDSEWKIWVSMVVGLFVTIGYIIWVDAHSRTECIKASDGTPLAIMVCKK